MVPQHPSDTPNEHAGLSLGARLRTTGSSEDTVDGLPRRRRTAPSPRTPAGSVGDATAEFDVLADDTGGHPAVPDVTVVGMERELGSIDDLTAALDGVRGPVVLPRGDERAPAGDEAAPGDGAAAEQRSHRPRGMVLVSLVLLAALAGLATGYAVVEGMGGWDAVWVGSDGDSGDPGSGVGGNPDGGELGQGGASPSPSQSASASPSLSGTPSASPTSGTGPPSPTPTSPRPQPTGQPTTPKPTTSPTPSPSEPAPSKSKPHD